MKDIQNILDTYSGEINAFTNTLSSSLSTNSHELHDKISDFSSELLSGISKISLREIFAGINKEDIRMTVSGLLNILERDENLQKLTGDAFKDIASCLGDLSIHDVTDRDEFIKSGSSFIEKLANNRQFEKLAKEIMLSSFDEAVDSNFSFIDEKTKKYVLNIFVDSCIMSLKKNLDDILKAVQFDQIAREEIENMEPKKIHEMFNSFGEKYFSRLMLYGFGGFVFGINMYIGFGLTALKMISGLIDKEK